MIRRHVTLAAVILVGGPLAGAAEPVPSDVTHVRGSALLAEGASLDLEYWSAMPRWRLRCRLEGAAAQGFDVELAFDGIRYQLLERRGDEGDILTAEAPASGAILLSAPRNPTVYRISLAGGKNWLPLRIERLEGQRPTALLELAYSTSETNAVALPREAALMVWEGAGPAFVRRGTFVLPAPATEAASAGLFSLEGGH
jgi:hypothetical protein